MTSITGGQVISRDGRAKGDVHFLEGWIVEESDSGDVVDGGGLTVAPGLIDTHIHGSIGHDFTSDPESIWEVGRWLPSVGVTSFVPTLVAAPYETYEQAIAVILRGPPTGYAGANAVGLHFEGPWLSPDWKGSHPEGRLALPDFIVASTWAESGAVSIVTMAPELPDSRAAAEILEAGGVNVSLGHSGGSYQLGLESLAGPWSSFTHLYNQMSGFGHREPGMVGAALSGPALVELIADGLHSVPAAMELAWRALGPDQLVLVTDSMQATGLGPGKFSLGDIEVTVDASGPRHPDGQLAGSVLTLAQAVSNLVEATSAPLEGAIRAASANPAKRLGLADRGHVDTGMRADLVLFDGSGQVSMTYVGGSLVFERLPKE